MISRRELIRSMAIAGAGIGLCAVLPNFKPFKVRRLSAATTIQFIGELAFDTSGYENPSTQTDVFNLPAGAQAGDLVFVVLANGNSIATLGKITTAGYTSIYNANVNNPGVQVAYKKLGDPADTTISISHATTSVTTGILQVWRYVDDAVQDVTFVGSSGSGTSNLTSSAITPITEGAIVISSVHADSSTTFDSFPDGYSNTAQNNTNSGAGATVGIASKEWSGAGAEDPGIFHAAAGQTYRAFTVALRPLPIWTILSGHVYETGTTTPVEGAFVYFLNQETEELYEDVADVDGYFEIQAPPGTYCGFAFFEDDDGQYRSKALPYIEGNAVEL